MAKESAAQRVERIKKEKNGLDVLQDIYLYAVLGEEINPEDIDRFKWYGLYTQNRNLQDEDDEKEPFVPTVYEPKELDMGDYSATPLTPKVSARMRIGGQPRAANQMKITGTSGY